MSGKNPPPPIQTAKLHRSANTQQKTSPIVRGRRSPSAPSTMTSSIPLTHPNRPHSLGETLHPIPGSRATMRSSASSGTLSLYQRCSQLEEDLQHLPTFRPFLHLALQSTQASNTATTFTQTLRPDPVTLLWTCFRFGSSLCHLVNLLAPGTIPDTSLQKPDGQSVSLSDIHPNQAKANVYHFLLACRNTLRLHERDLFAISELYRDDTNGFVKVLHTVDLVVQQLRQVGVLPAVDPQRLSVHRGSIDGRTHRDKVLLELVETERKYVADMERFQDFMRQVKEAKLISEEDQDAIYGNTDMLVDFQRKFLIGLEDVLTTAGNQEDTGVGGLFVQSDEGFGIYGPYCANHSIASETALRVMGALKPLSQVMDPHTELPSYLIKPIQRICRYPLLLKELIKGTEDKHAQAKASLLEAYDTMNRIVTHINELQRKAENKAIKKSLETSVENWKGFNLNNFGELLLDRNLMMVRKDVEKEVHMFLFERILICCKEIKPEKKKSSSLSFSRNSRKSLGNTAAGRHSTPTYQLKGGVTISEIQGITTSAEGDMLELKVFYKDYDSGEMENFVLKFLSEEYLKKWETALETLLDRIRRKSLAAHGAHLQPPATPTANRFTLSPDISQKDPTFPRPQTLTMTQAYPPRAYVQEPPVGPGFQLHSPIVSSSPTKSRPTLAAAQRSVLPEPVIPQPQVSATHPQHYPVRLPPPKMEDVPPPPSKLDLLSSLDQALLELGSALKDEFSMDDVSAVPVPKPISQPTTTRGIATTSQRPQQHQRQQQYLPSQPPPPEAQQPSFHPPPVSTNAIKVKVHHGQDISVLFLDTPNSTFRDLVARISDKLQEAGKQWTSTNRIRYQDEDGDFITVNSSEDLAVAIRLATAGKQHSRALNLYVQ